jgi:hypothetical protein
MQKEIDLETTINVGNELFLDVWKSKKSELEKTKSTLSENTSEYFNALNQTTTLGIIHYVNEHTNSDSDSSTFNVNGTVIARAVLSNRSSLIKDIKDLERFKDNSAFLKKKAKSLKLSEMCTKEIFVRIYRMDDEIKKEYETECKEMTDMCKGLDGVSKKYFNLIEKKSKEFGLKCKEGVIDKDLKTYMKRLMHSLKEDQHLISAVIQISNFSFNFRLNMLKFVNEYSSHFDHIAKKEFISKWKGKSVNTLYGGKLPLFTVNPESNSRVPDILKKSCFEIVKGFINHHFGSGSNLIDKTKIIWTKTLGEGVTGTEKTGDDGYFYVWLNDSISAYYNSIKGAISETFIPIEIFIVSTLIHELTHVFQNVNLTKDKKMFGRVPLSDIYREEPKDRKEQKKQINDIAGKSKSKRKTADKHMYNTFYKGRLNELDANDEKLKFILYITKQLYGDNQIILDFINNKLKIVLKKIFLIN